MSDAVAPRPPAIVRVAVPVPLTQAFDYAVRDGDPVPPVGSRVRVPFGRRDTVGIVVGHASDAAVAADRLKAIQAVLDPEPWLTEELLASLDWAARYYHHPLGEVLEAALPQALRGPRTPAPDEEELWSLLPAGREARRAPRHRRGTRTDSLLVLLEDGALSAGQLDERLPGWRTAARAARQRGWVERRRIPRAEAPARPLPGPPLNAEQRGAVEAIASAFGRFAPFVLDGVTGGGKTEVYLELIGRTIAAGRQSLVLVPEIALTPQMLRRFRQRLGVEIAVLHSGLGETERARAWMAAARGDAPVILGTRSAVFVPLPRPGLIVIDEEHDTSYKQQEGFRYHARDFAVVRARAQQVPIVLGSATPSLESLANVEAGRYVSLSMRQRAGDARPPALHVLDVRRQPLQYGLSEPALVAIGDCLDRGDQALVFRNRRGYAPVLQCRDCGWSAQCRHCDRPLTLHRGRARLICHHCGAEQGVPKACPDCGGLAVQPQGHGTERLEDGLRLRFPNVPIVRIDRDTTRSKRARETLLEGLTESGPRILIGTQMLAKGHDLASLNLVVLVSVDEGLFSADFRAGERLGQLVVQVAGRAGRAARPGQVWLQTHHPEHPLLTILRNGGYRALARNLIDERRAAGLPPYGCMALLRAEAKEPARLEAFLSAACCVLDVPASVRVLGPLAAPMPRRAGLHRGQIALEADERSALQAHLSRWLPALAALPAQSGLRWSIDVDPIDMS